jgi:hypothetical protein
VEAVGQRWQGSGVALAATWRDSDGAIVGASFGGTVCWRPNAPGRVRIVRDDYAVIARCRECPGCLELDRRRLADRLAAKYGAPEPEAVQNAVQRPRSHGRVSPATGIRLWLVRIYCDVANHAKLAHRLHRLKGLELEPGFWRLGTSSVALLCRDLAPPKRLLRNEHITFRTESVKLRRGRRAWRPLTAGLLVARERYGENLNRFYARGLPAAPREYWEVVKIPYEKGYSRSTSPRAWKGGKVVLLPPEIWKLKRVDRVALRRALGRAGSPEAAAQVIALASNVASARSVDSLLTASPRQLPSREQIEEFYEQMRMRSRRRREAATADSSLAPPGKGGAYASSIRSSDDVPTAEELAARDREAIERIRERQPGSLVSMFERLLKRHAERTGKPVPDAQKLVDKLRRTAPKGE